MAVPLPLQCKNVALQLTSGKRSSYKLTVRELLSWFGAERRTQHIIGVIMLALKELGIVSAPDFRYEFLDEPILLKPSARAETNTDAISEAKATSVSTDPQSQSVAVACVEGSVTDPTYRVGRLRAANELPAFLKPTDPITKATALMLAKGIAHLPVLKDERTALGIITWKDVAIGCVMKGQSEYHAVKDFVTDSIDQRILDSNTSLFDAIPSVIKFGAVLVRNREKGGKITGLVTVTDLSAQFEQLAAPFMLVGEIESHLRVIIKGLPIETLREAKNPSDGEREISSVHDLTFGECERILQNKYEELGLHGINRKILLAYLAKARGIRNNVMHFDPDGLDTKDLQELRECVSFLQHVGKR